MASKHLDVEYDADRDRVLLSVEDGHGNFAQVRMSDERALELAEGLMRAVKVRQWTLSGLLGA